MTTQDAVKKMLIPLGTIEVERNLNTPEKMREWMEKRQEGRYNLGQAGWSHVLSFELGCDECMEYTLHQIDKWVSKYDITIVPSPARKDIASIYGKDPMPGRIERKKEEKKALPGAANSSISLVHRRCPRCNVVNVFTMMNQTNCDDCTKNTSLKLCRECKVHKIPLHEAQFTCDDCLDANVAEMKAHNDSKIKKDLEEEFKKGMQDECISCERFANIVYMFGTPVCSDCTEGFGNEMDDALRASEGFEKPEPPKKEDEEDDSWTEYAAAMMPYERWGFGS